MIALLASQNIVAAVNMTLLKGIIVLLGASLKHYLASDEPVIVGRVGHTVAGMQEKVHNGLLMEIWTNMAWELHWQQNDESVLSRLDW